ncbi:hypothetical protein BDY24DRAFT_385016 [Mrakia frigida]|uniref:uncharacterized protein n=1 Tax=Mrakia frigida TaxID=29902 RepID=UPI003FCC12D3
MSSIVPRTASASTSGDSDDSEEEIYFEPTLTERLEEARSQRSNFFVAGTPISPESERKIAFLTQLYRKEPGLFFLSCARWNRKVMKGGVVWWSAAGVEEADPDLPKQDLSRGLPRNEEQYLEWEKERLDREAVPRTSLGNPKPSASSSSLKSKSLSLSSSRPYQLGSSSSSVTLPSTSGKRARTVSVPTLSTARSPKRRAISNEASLRQPSLPPPPPPPPSLVAQTISKSASASSSKLPKATSSNGSAKSTTSIHFPVTKRSTISPQDVKGSSSKISTPVQRASVQSSPKSVAGDATERSDDSIGKGMTSDGRLKGKEVAAAREAEEEEEDGDVSMMEEDGMKMRSLSGWDDMLDADSSAFDLFLPPSFPTDLASSTPNAKPRTHHSSKSHSHLSPLSVNKHKLGDLDGPDAKRQGRRDKTLLSVEGSTPSTSTSSSNITYVLTRIATSASLPPPVAPSLPKPKPSRLRPTESLQPFPPPVASTSLSVPQHLHNSKPIPSRASSSTGTGFSTPSEMGPPSSSLGGEEGGSQFPFDIRGSQVEGRMDEISRFMSEEELEGGSWAV